MKIKFTLLLCIVASLLMISCGDDDSESESGLQGTWEAFEFGGDVISSTTSAGTTIESNTNITGRNLDYTLVMSEDDFMTNGSYDIELAVVFNGAVLSSISDNYSNVSVSGTYTSTDTDIIVNGQFFELEVQGMSVTESSGPTTASYTIVDDVLSITQNEVSSSEQIGITTLTEVTFESKWRRK